MRRFYRFAALLAMVVVLPRAAWSAEVEVQLLGGRETVRGELAALGAEIAVVTSSGRQLIPGRDVLAVDFASVAPGEKPSVWLELIDGSKLHAVQVTGQEGKMGIELLGGTKVDVPSRSLRSIRFKSQDTELAGQWRQIGSAAGEAQGDVLVVRKTSQRTIEDAGNLEPKTVTETALDQLEGTVLAIKADTIEFDFQGNTVPVKREKVEGIYFYLPVKRELPPPTCKLVDAGGSEWSLKSVELRQSGVAGVTTSNVSIVTPLEQIARIDYSAGNVLYLGDVEPDNHAVSVALQPGGMQAKFERLYDSWQNRRFGTTSLLLGGVRYQKGLGLSGSMQLSYRVPEGFNHFRATAGIDDAVEQVGGVTLKILGDNKELFSRQFAGEDRGPAEVDLSVQGVRRLTIVVSPLQSQGYGDLVNLGDARLTK